LSYRILQGGQTKGFMKKEDKVNNPVSIEEQNFHCRISFESDLERSLDTLQLNQLEQSFRDWIEAASRSDIRLSRRRILLIFLLIRYTGAKLSEVLSLDPSQDIDFEKHSVFFGRTHEESGRSRRKVQMASTLFHEIREIITELPFKDGSPKRLNVDPGFVRLKFYERAEACGIAKQLGAPEILRKSRAVELMQNNMPLPAVQMLLGHSTPNLTSSYVSFSEDDLQQVTKLFMEKEFNRKTSARNSFFGKIEKVQKGDIQTLIELMTVSGHLVTTIITNGSLDRLGLKKGMLITAEVKAPYVILQKNNRQQTNNELRCSADNIFNGTVARITRGEINTEYIVHISDGTEVCSLVTSKSARSLCLEPGDSVWVMFNGFSVLLSE